MAFAGLWPQHPTRRFGRNWNSPDLADPAGRFTALSHCRATSFRELYRGIFAVDSAIPLSSERNSRAPTFLSVEQDILFSSVEQEQQHERAKHESAAIP